MLIYKLFIFLSSFVLTLTLHLDYSDDCNGMEL